MLLFAQYDRGPGKGCFASLSMTGTQVRGIINGPRCARTRLFRLDYGTPYGDTVRGCNEQPRKRVFEHKHHLKAGFTSKYAVERLLYFERFTYIQAAIAREKQIKGWRRDRKVALFHPSQPKSGCLGTPALERENPSWVDLSAGWFVKHRYQP